jgi:hypothetical protein
LTAQVTDPDGDALTVTWNVDGSDVQVDNVPAGGPPTSASVTLNFAYPLGVHDVIVTVSDGKAAPVSCAAKITVQDTTPPTIILKGDNPITLECPAPYDEPGATASDTCDPNPTLVISGTVDSHTPGTYTITYTATDASKNSSSTTRTVNVVDTTPPEIACSLTPTTNPAGQPAAKGKVPAGQNPNQPDKVGNPDGFFLVEFSAKDACDQNPVVNATICGFEVKNGEKIKYTQAPGIAQPKLVMIGPAPQIKHIICKDDPKLVVTATDASGNTATKECVSTVPPPAAPVLIPADFALRLKLLQLPDSIFIPADFTLGQNYPQPFNPETWIPYGLPKDVKVTIRIYNASGRLIRSLDLGQKQAGFYTSKDRAAYWDGRNDYGERLSSGIHFYTIQAGEYTATRKMLLLK